MSENFAFAKFCSLPLALTLTRTTHLLQLMYMLAIIVIAALSLVGIGETTYLIRKRIKMERPICVIGDSCATVLESKYSKLFLIPNDVLGLLAYMAILILSAFSITNLWPSPFLVLGITALVAVGSAASFIFAYLQWRVIKAWCFWCLMSAFTLWAMGIVLIVNGF